MLTLINGRRAFEFADVNAIPIGGLSRTEVLKDGAASIYGSDAVAGVVNFIMLNGPGEAPYQGAEAFALYGNTTETDAHVRQVYLRGGVATDKVSVAAAAEYYSRAGLFSRDRSKLAGSGNLTNGDPIGLNPPGPGALGRGGLNNNSPTFGGRVAVSGNDPEDPRVFPITGSLVLSDLNENQVTPGSYRRFDVVPGTDPARFNFRAFAPAIPAIEKAMYYVTGRYKIFGEGLQIYGDIMYSKTKQDNALAGAPFTVSNEFNGLTEAQNSIFNPFGDRLTQYRYRLQKELGNRRSFYDHDYYRYVAGLNGDFNFTGNGFISHLGYDSGLVYERFDEQRTDSGDATATGINNLVAANEFNPFIGQNAPVSGTAPTYINGVPTGQVAAYDNTSAGRLITDGGATYLGHSFFYERNWLVDAKVNVHLIPNLYNGGFDLAGGYEHREISQTSEPDPVQAANDQLGFNQSPNTKTLQKVDSYFAELSFPIVSSTMNVPGVRSLELSIAWRHEEFDYTEKVPGRQRASFENSNPNEDFYGSPRVSIRYQPFADLTLRGNWNQSFRAPSPANLFDPAIQDFPQLFDPVQRLTLQPPEGVYRRGATDVVPETTDTYSAGIVYTPKWLPGFTVTADYYQLFTSNLILSGNDFAQVLLTQGTIDPDGFGNGTGDPSAPGGTGLGITRDPVTGELIAIDSANGNAGKRFVQGLDVTAVYEIPTQSFGTFTFSVGWNHFFSWKAAADPEGLGTTNFLGNYNNGTLPLAPGGIPFNKGFLRGEWAWHGFDFVATGNYIGDYEDDPAFILGNDLVAADPGTGANPNYILHHRVSSYETLDLQLSYEFVKPEMQQAAATGYSKDSKDAKSAMSQPVAGVESSSIFQRLLWGTKVTAGVNNVFDRYPPTVLGAFNDNYDTSNYSIRNRYYYVSLTKKF